MLGRQQCQPAFTGHMCAKSCMERGHIPAILVILSDLLDELLVLVGALNRLAASGWHVGHVDTRAAVTQALHAIHWRFLSYDIRGMESVCTRPPERKRSGQMAVAVAGPHASRTALFLPQLIAGISAPCGRCSRAVKLNFGAVLASLPPSFDFTSTSHASSYTFSSRITLQTIADGTRINHNARL